MQTTSNKVPPLMLEEDKAEYSQRIARLSYPEGSGRIPHT